MIDDYFEYLSLMNNFRPVNVKMSKDEFANIYKKIQSNGKIFVYQVDNKIVASITIIEEYKFINNNGKVCHIEDVFVNKDFRKKGIATNLIEYVKKYCIKNKFYKMILNCDYELITYYEKFNFEKKYSMMYYFNH